MEETRLQISLILIGYSLNFILGIAGAFFEAESYTQMICWQFGDASAIMASVLTSRYIGTKGKHIVPSGFILLGIAYGVSLASSNFNGINEEKMAAVFLPLLPAMLLISIGTYFPLWIRVLTFLACVPFLIIYFNVITGTYSFDNPSNSIGYSGIQLLGIIWSVYIWTTIRNSNQQKA